MKRLPNRAFNSPLIRYANFNNGTHITLIKLRQAYANGDSWAIHQSTNVTGCNSGLFKTYEKANNKFNDMVRLSMQYIELIKLDNTGKSIN